MPAYLFAFIDKCIAELILSDRFRGRYMYFSRRHMRVRRLDIAIFTDSTDAGRSNVSNLFVARRRN